MIWKRAALIGLLTLTGLALETTVLGQATFAGTKPPLLLLVTVTIAMGEGAGPGAVAGFVTGLAVDLVGALPAGVSALVYTIVGYTVGSIRAQLALPSVRLPVAVAASATFAGLLLYGAVAALLGSSLDAGATVRHAVLGAAYNGLLTPFVFPVVRSLGRRLRPQTTLARSVM